MTQIQDHVITSSFSLLAHLDSRKQDKRMKPEQGAGNLGRNLRQAIMPSDVGQFVLQHKLKLVPLPTRGLFRQNNFRMENAPRKRGPPSGLTRSTIARAT